MSFLLKNNNFKLIEIESGIFHWHFYSGELCLEDYMIGYNLAYNYSKVNGKISVISTHEGNFHFAPETWAFISDKNADFSFVNRQAIVIDTLHLRLLASFFTRIRKNSFEVKIFKTKEKGLEWVKTKQSKLSFEG